jgi:dihydrofolate reductase
MIKSIFAVDAKGGIGKDGSLPWPKNTEDMKWFRWNTMGHVVVMGANTWFDPMMPKPLPGRTNVVVSNQELMMPEVIRLSGDFIPMLYQIEDDFPTKHLFIIGGKQIIEQTAHIVDEIVLTRFDTDYECDVIINIDSMLEQFELIESHQMETATYEIWKRII